MVCNSDSYYWNFKNFKAIYTFVRVSTFSWCLVGADYQGSDREGSDSENDSSDGDDDESSDDNSSDEDIEEWDPDDEDMGMDIDDDYGEL